MEETRSGWLFYFFGIIAVIALFGLVEIFYPYNFTKDDNLAQFLPVTLEGMNQLFSGQLPWINLHQFTGSKILETGTYALLYPPMIVSYFFSHYIFGNDFLTFEIFVLIHLLFGFFAISLFLSKVIREKFVLFLASLSFVFSGYVIIATSNWYYVIPTIIFLPILLYLNDKLREGGGLCEIIFLGLARGIYFYAGNAQYFAFAALFEFGYFILSNFYYKRDKSLLLTLEKYMLSWIAAIIVILPLLSGQLSVVKDSARGETSLIGYILSLPSSLKDIIFGSSIVYPLAHSSNVFSYSPPSFIHIYYIGAIFALFFIFGGIYLIFKYRTSSLRKLHPSFWLGIIAILLSLGYKGVIYIAGAFLPVINNFSNPFKITIFTNFFVICFGAIVFSTFYEKLKIRLKSIKKIFAFIFILTLIILIYHLHVSSQIAWSYYGDKLPLNLSNFNNLGLEGHRIISVFTNSSIDPQKVKYSTNTLNFAEAPGLSQNFATYFSVDHVAGYEPFEDEITNELLPITRLGISGQHINLTMLAEYGVKFVFLSGDSRAFHSELMNLTEIYKKDKIIILLVPNAKSYVFSEDTEIPYERLVSGVSFKTNFNETKIVTLNFIYKKEYRVEINGKASEIYADKLGRMFINVPAGTNDVRLFYYPMAFVKGIEIAFIALIILFVYLIFRKKVVFILKKTSEAKFISKVLLYFNEKKKVRKLILLLILILLILFLFIAKTSIFEANNLSNLAKERTNLNVKIGSTQTHLLSGQIYLNGINISNPGMNGRFYSEKIVIYIDYIDSIKETLNAGKPQVIFREITLINSSFYYERLGLNPGVCAEREQLNIEMEKLSDKVYLKSTKINIFGAKFLPLNKAFFTISNTSIYQEEKLSILDANMAIEKYVHGNISISSSDKGAYLKKESYCISLPLKVLSNLYY